MKGKEAVTSEIRGMDPGALLRGVADADTDDLTAPSNNHNWHPPSPSELNSSIDVFDVTGLIGRGGMGAVYHARQVSLGRDVAIKILPKELSTSAVFARRFRREARSLASLQHPGIVTVYDFGQTMNGILYLVMEFIDGPHLGQLMRIGEPDLARKLEIMIQVCDSLIYAHGQGFIHRDIKPGNILVTKTGAGVAKLVDFGLAKLVENSDEDSSMVTEEIEKTEQDSSVSPPATASTEMLEKISFEIRNPLNAIIGYSEMLQEEAGDAMAEDLQKINEAGQTVLNLINERINNSEIDMENMKLFLNNSMNGDDDLSRVTATGSVVGTGDYMAPEQFEGTGELDPRTDIYSLGVVLYEIITGTRPRGRWKNPSQLVEGLDPRIDYLVNKALEPDLEERLPSVVDFRERLVEVRERLDERISPSSR